MKYRVKCPNCGNIADINGGDKCKCGYEFNTVKGGMIRIYRMGSPIGIANGFGIYIDGEGMGMIGNKQTVNIPVSLGEHKVHVVCGMNRRCNDPILNLTVDKPLGCVKVHMKPGFFTNSFVVEEAEPESMPAE